MLCTTALLLISTHVNCEVVAYNALPVTMACQSEGFDFASLPILDEAILLEGLRNRYERDVIYVCKLMVYYDY